MKMKRCTAAILLMLSLEALVAGRLSAAVVVADTILLPIQGRGIADAGHEATSPAVAATEAWPWKCCDPDCTIRIPPSARCPPERLTVQEATAAVAATEEPRLLNDTRLLNSTGHVSTSKAEAAASEKSVANGDDQGRPWKCCDDTLCTRSAPPTCQCLDKVKKCAKTCKSCEKADKQSNGASSRFVCLDRYFGWPGPKCGKSGAAGVRGGN